jgi:hypothetical protein
MDTEDLFPDDTMAAYQFTEMEPGLRLQFLLYHLLIKIPKSAD